MSHSKKSSSTLQMKDSEFTMKQKSESSLKKLNRIQSEKEYKSTEELKMNIIRPRF